jgi:molybdate transport system substrate-binding protein
MVYALSVAAAAAAQLNVSAAASLADALQELAPRFQAATGHTLRFNFGGSGTLVRQIKEGAPADVIFSADETRMQQLDSAGLILPGSQREIVANMLVVVVPPGSPVRSLADLAGPAVTRVAIGDPASVPAGTYAVEFLKRVHRWTVLAPKCVPLENVRAVRAAVEAGDADAGFVYRSDALGVKTLRVAVEISGGDAPHIVYPFAVLQGTKEPVAARQLVDFLLGRDAQATFARYGFLPVAQEER